MAADSPGWPSVLNTTIPQFFREVEVNVLRDRILLAMMEKNGSITYNNSGTKYDWKVRFKRAGMIPYASDDTISFNRVDRYKTAQLPNDRGYIASESMGEIDTLQNNGAEAIVKLWDEKTQVMAEDLRENFCDQLYVDGNATGNTKRFHGIESFMGAAAVAPAPGFVKPNDSYADLSTTPAAYGGSWTNGTYPEGSGSEEYAFWSPILVDYASPVSGAYSATDRTWPNTCTEAMRRLLTWTRKQKSKEGMIDLLLLQETLFYQYKNSLENSKQIVYDSAGTVAMRAMGFDVLSIDGATISTEYGMPTFGTTGLGIGYAFNTKKMEMKILRKQLFESVGPIYNEEDNSYRWLIKITGNLKCNPKFFGKLAPYNQA